MAPPPSPGPTPNAAPPPKKKDETDAMIPAVLTGIGVISGVFG